MKSIQEILDTPTSEVTAEEIHQVRRSFARKASIAAAATLIVALVWGHTYWIFPGLLALGYIVLAAVPGPRIGHITSGR